LLCTVRVYFFTIHLFVTFLQQQIFPSGLFPSGFVAKGLYKFLLSFVPHLSNPL